MIQVEHSASPIEILTLRGKTALLSIITLTAEFFRNMLLAASGVSIDICGEPKKWR